MSHGTRPKWEEDQIKSFVGWANFRWGESLKARGRPVVPLINDIHEDFKDGTRAAMLLMVLFERQITGIKKSGKLIDKIQNWTILLNEMKKEGIDFRKASSDLVNGDLQATLAFQWATIRHNGSTLALDGLVPGSKKTFKSNVGGSSAADSAGKAASTATTYGSSDTTLHLAGSGTSTTGKPDTSKQVSVKEQMLRYLNTYLPSDLQVSNFTTSFQDGRVIRHLLSNLAHVDVTDSSDPKTLLDNCFSTAEHNLGIPAMMSAEDLSRGQVAEEPVMTYVISILQGIRNRSEEGQKAAEASNAHLAALEGGDTRSSSAPQATNTASSASATSDAPPPLPPRVRNATMDTINAQAQTATAGMASYGVAGTTGVAGQATITGAGDQNYLGSIVQGSVMMELPEIFKIVAFGDYKNFVAYANAHPSDVFTLAEPYRINLLFTAARLVPHVTGKKFMEFILSLFPNSHTMQDRKGNYPVHEALEYGCLENFDFLWNLPGAPRPPLPSLIHQAVWPLTTDCLERVLQVVQQAHGGTIPPLDTFILEGRTPLITALSTPNTSIEMVRALLMRGSNPGFSSIEGQSPALVVAAACDKWEAVGCMARESLYQPLPLARLLCALLFIVGVTPQNVAKMIQLTGTPTNDEDPLTGRTPLEHAVSLARPDLVAVLLQHGAQVNRVSPMQPWRTPIHYALLYYAQDPHKYLEVVRVLQGWGADFNAHDANGQPASNYARNLGLPPIPVGYNYAAAAAAM